MRMVITKFKIQIKMVKLIKYYFQRALAVALNEEVVKPLRQLSEAQHRIRKSVETAVDKAGRGLQEWRTAESKSKKVCCKIYPTFQLNSI